MKFSTAILAFSSISLASALAPPQDRSDANGNNVLLPRKGCAEKTHGCEDGYCWKKCGPSGSWCWLAYGAGGSGDWVRCTSNAQCEKRTDAWCAAAGRPHGGCGC